MKRLITTLFVLALLATACGNDDTGNAGPVTIVPNDDTSDVTTTTTTTTTNTVPGSQPVTTTTTTTVPVDQADQVFIQVYFVADGLTAQAVVRAVDTPDVAANAIRALISGPTAAEADSSLSSAIPPDTLLLGLTIDGGRATIDLSREFESGGGSFGVLSRLAQVVYTLTQFDTVDDVLFHLDGEPVEIFSGEGVILDDPVDGSDYATILPIAIGPDPTDSEAWIQADLADLTGVDPANLGRVALVTEADVLNVRVAPGTGSAIIGMLAPGVVVELIGLEQIEGSSVWVQVETPIGQFWLNSHFLAAVVTPVDFSDDPAIADLLDEFSSIIVDDGDLRLVTSQRGLFVSHHGDPIRFSPDELSTILTDPTTYQWPSNAIGPDNPEFDQIPGRTFSEAVADSFVSVYDDPDTELSTNEPIAGGNGRIPEAAIPFVFESFNYVGVYDLGDDPQFDGLDWTTWYVSIDYENGVPVIVGLTIDQWAP